MKYLWKFLMFLLWIVGAALAIALALAILAAPEQAPEMVASRIETWGSSLVQVMERHFTLTVLVLTFLAIIIFVRSK